MWVLLLVVLLVQSCSALDDIDKEFAFFVEDILSESVRGSLQLETYADLTRFSSSGRVFLWYQLPSPYNPQVILDGMFRPRANAVNIGISTRSGSIGQYTSVYQTWLCYSKSEQGDKPTRWNSDPRPAMLTISSDSSANSTIRTWPSLASELEFQTEPTIAWCMSAFEEQDSDLGLNRTWTKKLHSINSSNDVGIDSFEGEITAAIEGQNGDRQNASQAIMDQFRVLFNSQVEGSIVPQLSIQVQLDQLSLIPASNVADIELSRNLKLENLTSLISLAVGTAGLSQANQFVSGSFLAQNRISYATDTKIALAGAAALSGLLLDFSSLDSNRNISVARRLLGDISRFLIYVVLVFIDLFPLVLLLLQEIDLGHWGSLFVGSSGIFSLVDGGTFSGGKFSDPEGRAIALFFEIGHLKLLNARTHLIAGILGIGLTVRGFFFIRRVRLHIRSFSRKIGYNFFN